MNSFSVYNVSCNIFVLYHNIWTSGMKMNKYDIWSTMLFVEENLLQVLVYSYCTLLVNMSDILLTLPRLSVWSMSIVNENTKDHLKSFSYCLINGFSAFCSEANVTCLLTQSDIGSFELEKEAREVILINDIKEKTFADFFFYIQGTSLAILLIWFRRGALENIKSLKINLLDFMDFSSLNYS